MNAGRSATKNASPGRMSFLTGSAAALGSAAIRDVAATALLRTTTVKIRQRMKNSPKDDRLSCDRSTIAEGDLQNAGRITQPLGACDLAESLKTVAESVRIRSYQPPKPYDIGYAIFAARRSLTTSATRFPSGASHASIDPLSVCLRVAGGVLGAVFGCRSTGDALDRNV